MCRHGFYSDYHTRFRSDYVCTYEMAKKIGKKKLKVENFKLGTLCSELDIPLENAHSAADDVLATYWLYEKLKPMMPKEETVKKYFKTYAEKRAYYLDIAFIQLNPEGDIFISSQATRDPEALQFIINEIYDLFCDEGITSESESPSSE